MHQNGTCYAELNGEHADEGFIPLRLIILEIWTRETKKSWNFRKFDLWPVITGSNIDLGHQKIPPFASTRWEQSAGLLREALWCFVWKRQGGRTNFTPAPAKVEKHSLRARVNQYKIKFQNVNIPELYVLKTYKQAVYVANFKSISYFLTTRWHWFE